MRLRTFCACFCCFLLAAVAVFAQQAFYGSIVGNVTDASGAVIPSASVKVTNVETGVTLDLKTNSLGTYEAQNLNPSTYQVKVTAPGFKTFVRENVILAGGQEVRADARLEVGTTGQQVTVTASTLQINTETATTTIPVITHDAMVTLPNVSGVPTWPDPYNGLLVGYADLGNNAYSIGGAISTLDAEVQDGMRVEGQNNYVGGSRGLARPSVDSVDELIITTSEPSAEYPEAAAIETVMKSGTNIFHGSLWWDWGNKDLNAGDYFTHVQEPFIINHYGGSVGGPIRKDKTFVFFSYQGFDNPTTAVWTSSIPTAQMMEGNLSAFLNVGYAGLSQAYPVHDPLTGQSFPDNIIPSALINPIAQKVLSYYPSQPNFNSGLGYADNYLNPYLVTRKEENWDLRPDQYWTPGEHTYVRWTHFHSPNADSATYLPGFGGNFFIMDSNILTVHHTSTLRPNLLNHVMFGLFRESDPLGPGLYEKEGSVPNYVTTLGIPGVPATQQAGFPWFSFSQTNLSQPYTNAFTGFYERFIELRDDVTWEKGRHNIHAGFDFRRNTQGSAMVGGAAQINSASCPFGCFNFTGYFSGLDFGDFLLGYPFTTSLYTMPPPNFNNRNEEGLFIQDDIKVTKKLNVSLGLRYDLFPSFTSENGFLDEFDPAKQRFIVATQAGISAIPSPVSGILPYPVVSANAAGLPPSLVRTEENNFGPRIGFAYRLMKDTVVRGGFGLYYDPLVSTARNLFSGFYAMTQSYPTVQPAPGATPILTMQNPFTGSYSASSSISFVNIEPNIRIDKTYSYNLAVERQWRANAITVEYSNKSSIIPYWYNMNAVEPSLTPFSGSELPFPSLGFMPHLANGLRYWYNGLRVDAKRRMATGLFFDVTYVYNKEIDDLGGIYAETGFYPENPFDRDRDRGRGGILPPHRLTINYIYQVPFGQGRLGFASSSPAGRVVNQVVKGWELAGTYNFQTSPPLTVTGNYLNSGRARTTMPPTQIPSLGEWIAWAYR